MLKKADLSEFVAEDVIKKAKEPHKALESETLLSIHTLKLDSVGKYVECIIGISFFRDFFTSH